MAAEDELYAKRLGFWLRAARERAGKSQGGAAEFLGFSPKSKSTISDYETGVTVPSLPVLRRLAEWYGLPLETFTDPAPTPEERLDEISRLAARREQREWGGGRDQDPGAADEPGAGPQRLTA
jgi:transcriptional regulator with XRE-family HTH domain